MFRTCIPKRDKNSEWFFRKCSKFQKSPKNRNFPKQTSRLTLERYYHTLEFPETLAQQALTPSKWILLLITFVYCLFIGNSLCGHWTRIWPSRYDREHLTTVKYNQTALISEKTIMQIPLKWSQFNLELDFVSSTCHIKGSRPANFRATIHWIYNILYFVSIRHWESITHLIFFNSFPRVPLIFIVWYPVYKLNILFDFKFKSLEMGKLEVSEKIKILEIQGSPSN